MPAASRRTRKDSHPISALSPSRAKDFLQCPRLFFYKTILGISTPPSEATLRGTLAHYAFERVFDHPVGERGPDVALGYADAAWHVVTDPLRERAEVPPGSFEARLRDVEERYRDLHEPGSAGEAKLLAEASAARGVVAEDRVEGFLETVRAVVRGWYAMENPDKFTPAERELYVRARVGTATVHGFIDRFDAVPVKDGSVRHYVSDYKGLAIDTPLPTPSGWTTMARVAPGDLLLGASGSPVRVLEKTPEQRLDCFELLFEDDTRIVADAVHLWETLAPLAGVFSTAEIATMAATSDVLLPGVRPCVLPERTLPLPAYETGTLVGAFELLSPFSPEFTSLVAVSRSSQGHRVEFLRGLLAASSAASSGTSSPSCLCVRDEAVADLVSEVARLAGLSPRPWSRDAGLLRARVSEEEVAALVAGTVPDPAPVRVVSVRRVPSVVTACVRVDAPDHLYLAGRAMVPTHNTGKKPSARFTDEAFFQLEVYALALAESRDVTPHALRLVYTNEASRDGVLERVVTPELIERTRRKVRSVWDAIAKADRDWHAANLRGDASAMERAWETRKQPLCDWCHFGPKQTNVCPAWNPALAGMLPEEEELRLSARPGGPLREDPAQGA